MLISSKSKPKKKACHHKWIYFSNKRWRLASCIWAKCKNQTILATPLKNRNGKQQNNLAGNRML